MAPATAADNIAAGLRRPGIEIEMKRLPLLYMISSLPFRQHKSSREKDIAR
jgi:hypothetical protein